MLPAGLAFVSASGGNYDADTGLWTMAALDVGATAVLTIQARMDVETRQGVPTEYELQGNYPNPFNPATVIP